MDESIVNIFVRIHSPGFKPWAMKTLLQKKSTKMAAVIKYIYQNLV